MTARRLAGRLRLPGRIPPLAGALGVSLALHALLLAVRFVPPDAARVAPADSPLEVVLLNATDRTEPLVPQVLAQASMQGGGEREHDRPRSPLPAAPHVADGDSPAPRAPRNGMPGDSPRLLAPARAPDGLPERPAPAARVAQASPPDEADAQRTIMRLQAQLARDLNDEGLRPRRLTYGINAVGVPYARYVDAWAERIERLGTLRYPPEARGRHYGSLVVLAEIDRHGNVVDVRIPRPSRHASLNRAAREIVLAGQPYERFTAEMAREGDILQIVRTWTFTRAALETAAAATPAAASPAAASSNAASPTAASPAAASPAAALPAAALPAATSPAPILPAPTLPAAPASASPAPTTSARSPAEPTRQP